MKPTLRKIFVLSVTMILSLIVFSAYSQGLKGRVTSPDGTPLTGVSVLVKGTSQATLTNGDGQFYFRQENGSATLLFSYIGYETQEMPVDNHLNLAVVLKQGKAQLSEVVVTALGIKKEDRKVGYSIQTIKGTELNKARDVDVFTGLEGKVAGVTIGTSPEMLGTPQIVARGVKDMLIVVDGVPINSDTYNVNADDVESTSILKGPNAAALYGFRGQNGAIIITTKKGSKDIKGWQISFNSTTMIEQGFLVLPKDQNEYGRGTKFQYSFGDGLDDHTQRLPTWGPRMEGQLVKQYNSPYDVTAGVRTPTPYNSIGANNYKNFIEAGVLSTNNLTLASSGSNYDIRISYSHVYQKGTDPNTKLNMDNLNITADYAINDKLKFDANLNLNVQYTPNIPNVIYGPNSYVYMFNVYGNAAYDVRDLKNAYQPPMGAPGLRQYSENYGRSNNPYFMAQNWLNGHNKTDIYGYARLSYNLTPELVASLRTAVTTWSQQRNEKVPAGTILNQYLPWYYWGWYGDYRQDNRNLLENNTDFLLAYNHKFSNWNLSANVGANERSFQYSSTYGTTVDLAVPGVYSLSNSQTPSLSYSWGSRMQVYSGYYSVDIGYKNFFTLSTTGRVDNLSTLPSGYNTFFYPSVSLSSSLGEYLKLPEVISYLKIRASYADVKGALTNSRVASAYTQVTGISTGTLLGYGTDLLTSYQGPTYANQNVYGITTYGRNQPAVSYSTTLANPTIQPYDVKSTEVGMNLQMLKNRVGVDVTYFTTTNGPQIYAIGVPSSTSYNSKNVNGITTQRKGWEITLNAAPLKSQTGLNWNFTVNWSTYIETLKDIYGSQAQLTLNNHNYTKGERLDDWYSTRYVLDGAGNIVWNGGGPQLSPGGINNNGYMGHLNPDYVIGMNNSFSYKSFTFSFQFDGRVGGVIYDDIWYHAMNGGTAIESDQGAIGTARLADWTAAKDNGGTLPGTYLGSYIGQGVKIVSGTPTYANGQITNLKDITFAKNDVPTTVQNYLSSTLNANVDQAYTISRTYMKLREVQLVYNFPHSMLGKTFIKTASVALVGRNLLYFAARKDFDIDQYASGFDAYSRQNTGTSADVNLSSPTFRRYGININIGF
jgi:TonB-linked SusC/RagA family outer membrane protein